MGATNSNTNVTAVPAGSLLTQPGFRVKVTRDGKELTAGGAVMDPVEKAYQRGKEEGHAAIHTALDSVAAQVYDNIHEQLLNIQKQNLEKSEQMVSSIKTKLAAPVPATKSCSVEEGVLTACLKSHSKNPLSCSDMVTAYQQCATKVLV